MFLFYRANIFLILTAVIPAVYLLNRVCRADKLEKEPTGLILSLVIQGIFATFFAMATEMIGQSVLRFFYSSETLAYRLLMYFGVVACSEEGFKYWLLKKRTWRDPNFNCLFDGIVYAVSVGLGFSLWENIGYVFQYGFAVALMRSVTAVPGHASFGVFMGLFYGMAKRFEISGKLRKADACLKWALLSSIVLHGAYDFIATGASSILSLTFIGFILTLFGISLKIVRITEKSDHYF